MPSKKTGFAANESPYISVRGAREHNLRGVNIDLPRNQLVVITGLSGSGKSSLAFDTIYAEGKRRRASVALGEIRPTLERLAAAGLKIGIATNDAEGPARRDMEHIGVADLCDVIYGHDSHGAKPGPEMMAAFCAETGLRPDQVAMVGDTMTDLRFARNAGAHSCIGIIDPSYANQPFVEGVDVQVEHVDAIPALLGL